MLNLLSKVVSHTCPICERGTLVQIESDTWNCSRPRCNNQFFHDTDGTLNVRDKPTAPLFSRLWLALAVVATLAKDEERHA